MKILLTGAAGFTGRFFHELARSAGHVIAPLAGDLTDKQTITAEVLRVQPDTVVHLAATSFVGHKQEADFYATNVVGTANLLEALTHLPRRPRCVLLASSANIYGNCGASPISEAEPPSPVNHYAMSKLGMEYMARNFLDRLPVIFARPFNYTGSGQSLQFLIPKLVAHFARRANSIELGNLHVKREFNDVRFICEAYLSLLETGVQGESYNICTGKTYSLTDVISLLEQLTSHQLAIQVNPAFVRANEVHRLCGDPRKLFECIGPLNNPDLSSTLAWMLSEASQTD
jgi:nucleoside-diphosphate-sugar epimerase